MSEPVGVLIGTKQIVGLGVALVGGWYLTLKHIFNKEIKRIDKNEADIKKLQESMYEYFNAVGEEVNTKLDVLITRQDTRFDRLDGRIDDALKRINHKT